MTRLRLHLHVGRLYFMQALKMRMEYRADFFVECLAALLQQASGLLMLLFMFNNFHALTDEHGHTWTREEVLFIYGFSLIPMSFFDAFAMSFYNFSDKYIVGGELDRLLLRPLSSLFQLLMEGISFDFIADLTLGIVVLAYAWQHAGPPVDGLVVLQFLLYVAGAWGVVTGVFLTLTSMSFWSSDRISFLPPVYNLLNFARYPLSIYRPIVRILLTWIVPFGFVAFYPSAAFLEHGAPFRSLSALVPLAGVFLLTLGGIVWHHGMRRYSGAGS
ncbi:MAG TPA: ABC-2 family transporter protein [Planctomycetota bacterium]|nr:ABC-2 family transporter protein [Planctomycetota bacterium]